jgi:hypothetical protein
MAAPEGSVGAEEGDVLSGGKALEEGKDRGGNAMGMDREPHEDNVVAL